MISHDKLEIGPTRDFLHIIYSYRATGLAATLKVVRDKD